MRIVEDPVLRQRYQFRRVAGDDGTETLEIDIWVDPGGGVTPHVHPSMEERFQVVSGEVSLLSGRRWLTARPGDAEVVVPAGTRHAFRNRTRETVHFVTRATPPENLQEFLEDVAGLSRAGMTMLPGLPRNLRGLLAAAVVARHYRPMAVLLVPPPFVQRLLLDPLARLAERRGYRAGSFA